MSKTGMGNYIELKLREKAKVLSEVENISFEKASEIIKENRIKVQSNLSEHNALKKKAKQYKKAHRKKTTSSRKSSWVGSRLTKGAWPVQGGAPGLGKNS